MLGLMTSFKRKKKKQPPNQKPSPDQKHKEHFFNLFTQARAWDALVTLTAQEQEGDALGPWLGLRG